MSSRRVLVVALLGAAAYCSLEPEAPARAVTQRPVTPPSETGITPMPPVALAPVAVAPVVVTPVTTAAVVAVAPSPAPALPPRPAPEATGRIEPLHAAPQIVHEATPPPRAPSPYTVVAEPAPSRGAWFPMPAPPAPIPEAVAPQTAYYPPPPMFVGYPPPPDHSEALNRLIETAQQLESRVERLDTRLTQRPERELPPPGPRLESIHGAAPAARRRAESDTAKGFDLAVRLIRRLMARIDRIEENLDIQEEAGPEDRDLHDPSATGLWRTAPPVR